MKPMKRRFESETVSFELIDGGLISERYKNVNSYSKDFNLVLSNVEEFKRIDSRTISIPHHYLDSYLMNVADSLKAFRFKTSKLKLKFTLLSSENIFPWTETENLNNFISHLRDTLEIVTTFQVKYYDAKRLNNNLNSNDFLGPNPIAKLTNRHETGQDQIFNFVYLLKPDDNSVKDSDLQIPEDSDLLIPDWGVVQIGSKVDFSIVMRKFLSALREFLGFQSDGRVLIPEMAEIEIWSELMKREYLRKSFDLLDLLERSKPSGVILPSEIFESKLSEWKSFLDEKSLFDSIFSAFHSPKLMAAAYFPDDHKLAVYLPVYLPLILPILVALLSVLKEQKKKRELKNKMKTSNNTINTNDDNNNNNNNKKNE